MSTFIESSVEGSLGNILRTVNTWLYEDMAGAMSLAVNLGCCVWVLDMLYVMGDVGSKIGGFAQCRKSCGKEGS